MEQRTTHMTGEELWEAEWDELRMVPANTRGGGAPTPGLSRDPVREGFMHHLLFLATGKLIALVARVL